jgi:uncharacterized membrane protein YiaA
VCRASGDDRELCDLFIMRVALTCRSKMDPAKDHSAPVVAVPPASAMVYMPFQTPRPRTFDRYKDKQSVGLGVTMIIISILCFIFNSVCIGMTRARGNELSFVGHGYWCGIMFLITGIFGVVAGKRKTRCMIVSFMVFCILSAIFTIGLLVVGILGAINTDTGNCNDDYYYYNNYGYYYSDYYYPNYRSICYTVPHYKVIIAMESLLAIAGFFEVIAAIWGAALTCGSGVCCCSSPPMGVMPPGGYFPQGGQMICINQTQGGPYVYAPQPTFGYPQGMVPAPAYVQPAWTNSGPAFGAAPPAYAANQGQPMWMIQPATSNPGQLDAQATNMVPSETKERP